MDHLNIAFGTIIDGLHGPCFTISNFSSFTVPGDTISTRPLPKSDEKDDDVTLAQVPWMASLGGFKTEDNWDHQCGGSLVTHSHILTAAHCFGLLTNEYINGPQMRLGTADMTNSSLGTMRNIVDFLQHPKYVVTR